MNPNETQAAQLFLLHHDFVKSVALKHAPWPGLMDDITQQVFLEFINKQAEWDLTRDVRPLLATMTRFVALRQWREKTRQQSNVVQKLADHIRLLAEEEDVSPHYEDEIMLLRVCLKKLPEKSRALITLYYYDDCGTPQIAEKVNMKPDTVCRAISRVRDKLRTCIQQAQKEQSHV